MSNNGLAVKPQPAMALDETLTDLSGLPGWIAMLVGCYPQSWANELTYAMLERKFARYGDEVMLAAVEAYTDEQEGFPTPAALRPYVDRFVHDGVGDFIRSMARAGYTFKGDIDNVMHFESVATGQPTVVYH